MKPAGAAVLLTVAVVIWCLLLLKQKSPERRHLEAGIDFARQHRGDLAEQEWRQAILISPNDPHPWEFLSEYYLDMHNWPAALDALRNLERRAPDDPRLQARLAACSLQAGDEQAAYRYAAKSLQHEPDDADTIRLFCGLLAHTGENERRMDLLRRLNRLHPDDISDQLLLTEALTDRRLFAEASPSVERILQRDPNNLEALSLHGMISLGLDPSSQGLRRAEADFLRTVGAARFAPFAHFNLGKIYVRLGAPKKAVPHLETAAIALPTKPEVFFELSGAYTQTGQSKQAEAARRRFETLRQNESRISVLNQRCAADPGDFDAHLELAQRSLQRGDLREASIHLDRAQTIRPDDAQVAAVRQKLSEARLSPSDTAWQAGVPISSKAADQGG